MANHRRLEKGKASQLESRRDIRLTIFPLPLVFFVFFHFSSRSGVRTMSPKPPLCGVTHVACLRGEGMWHVACGTWHGGASNSLTPFIFAVMGTHRVLPVLGSLAPSLPDSIALCLSLLSLPLPLATCDKIGLVPPFLSDGPTKPGVLVVQYPDTRFFLFFIFLGRLPGGEDLLRPRHRRAVPHGADGPALPQEQGKGCHEAWPHLHHRTHDQRRDVAGTVCHGGGRPGVGTGSGFFFFCHDVVVSWPVSFFSLTLLMPANRSSVHPLVVQAGVFPACLAAAECLLYVPDFAGGWNVAEAFTSACFFVGSAAYAYERDKDRDEERKRAERMFPLTKQAVTKERATLPPLPALSPHRSFGEQDRTWPDNWTSVTADGQRSAQFEHTLLVSFFFFLNNVAVFAWPSGTAGVRGHHPLRSYQDAET